MTVEAAALQALRLPPSTPVESSPLTSTQGRRRLLVVRPPAADPLRLIARGYANDEAAANNAAVLEALNRIGYAHAPKLLGFAAGQALEAAPAGPEAIAIAIDDHAAGLVARALAVLHLSPLREGLRWGLEPSDILTAEELPLFRLGFTSEERAAAASSLRAIAAALRESPTGPVHGDAVAANVIVDASSPTLVDFASAGYGVQLFDVAAFALTAGLSAESRRRMAESYAEARGLPAGDTADLVDAASLLWGLLYLMGAPRREIELLGDDAAVAWVQLMARRVSEGVQVGAGSHPAATALRRALWPQGSKP